MPRRLELYHDSLTFNVFDSELISVHLSRSTTYANKKVYNIYDGSVIFNVGQLVQCGVVCIVGSSIPFLRSVQV